MEKIIRCTDDNTEQNSFCLWKDKLKLGRLIGSVEEIF